MSMFAHRLGRLGLLLGAALALGACNRAAAGGKDAGPDGGQSAAPLAVSVVTVASEERVRKIEVTGTLAAWEEALVSVEADGRLAQVKVDLGSHVKRGELLAQIAAQEYSLRKTQAEAELAASRADLARVEQLVAKDIGTRQQLDEARRRYEIARTNAELQNKKLGDTAVRAPIEGIVAKRLVNLGEFVRTGSPAFQIVRTTPLKFKGDVPERHAPVVKIGDEVEASGEALGDTILTGKIVHVSPSVSADTRSFAIEAQIENPDERFKPGSFARLAISAGAPVKVITVPDKAVTEFAGNKRVFVVQGELARERRVELDGKVGDRAIVAKGLEPGEQVIVTALETLSDGAKITVRKGEPPAAGQTDAGDESRP